MNLQNTAPHVKGNSRVVWSAILAVVVMELALVAAQLPRVIATWSLAPAAATVSASGAVSQPAFHAVPLPTPPAAAHHPAATPAPSFTSAEPQPRPVPTPPASH